MLIKFGRLGELYIGKLDTEVKTFKLGPVRSPHSDTRILHAPNICHHCNMFPEYQQYRLIAGINFTGEFDKKKAPCPTLWQYTNVERGTWSAAHYSNFSPEEPTG